METKETYSKERSSGFSLQALAPGHLHEYNSDTHQSCITVACISGGAPARLNGHGHPSLFQTVTFSINCKPGSCSPSGNGVIPFSGETSEFFSEGNKRPGVNHTPGKNIEKKQIIDCIYTHPVVLTIRGISAELNTAALWEKRLPAVHSATGIHFSEQLMSGS